jgi:hypothetical protein
LARWQGWAEAYQQGKEPDYQHVQPLAHTEYNGALWEDRELSRQITRQIGGRGPHAAPGALIALSLLPTLLTPTSEPAMRLLLCALGAVLGHHGGWLGGEDNGELGAGPLWCGWRAEVSELLGRSIDPALMGKVETALGAGQKRQTLAETLHHVTSVDRLSDTWPLLAYLTRTLRLSDWKATEEGSDGA